jgi:2-polyprenyl-3-methyl-5-hydroxy-6-metoxy-1,4-benzoquinol methylase
MFAEHEVEWTNEKVSRFWDYLSRNEGLVNTYFTHMVGDQVISHLNTEIGLQGKTILDFGCGPGYLLESLARKRMNVTYYGLDFSEDSVSVLKEKFQHTPQFGGAFYAPTYPTNIQQQFDVVVCCEVVEHLNDEMMSHFIAEVKRLLKPGGYVYITTPNNENLNESKVLCPDCGCVFHRWQHVRQWNPESLSAYLNARGIRTFRVKALNYIHGKYPLLAVWDFLKRNLRQRPTRKHNLCFIGQADRA